MSVYDDDRSLHEAIGHMAIIASPFDLAKAARQTRDAGDTAVAAHLLRWADLHASLSTLDFEDRRRHWPSLIPLDDEYPWENGDERLNDEGCTPGGWAKSPTC